MQTSSAISRREAGRSLFAAAALGITALSTRAATAEQTRLIPGPRHSDRIPDVILVNHRKKRFRFYSDLVKDRAVVISFIYTQCQGSCPATVGVMKRLRADLSRDFGQQLRLLSVTLDPERDTPAALANYAALQEAGRARLGVYHRHPGGHHSPASRAGRL